MAGKGSKKRPESESWSKLTEEEKDRRWKAAMAPKKDKTNGKKTV